MKPLLVYDGDCGFCRMWIGYWKQVTGDRIGYAPYQEAAERFPQVPIENFKKTVQLILPDGQVFSAAHAVFQTLGDWPLRAYEKAPGFAPVTEWLYRRIAAHRSAGYWVTRVLWGAHPQPPTYSTPVWLFLRLLGLIYLIAFVSLGVQVRGLIGGQGILPLRDFLEAVRQHYGVTAYWHVPTLFWLNASDGALVTAALAGAALSVALILGWEQRVALILLCILYLSLSAAGQEFLSFQWDVLLLEAGFLAIFLKPSLLPVWLLRWLLFRLMLLSGATKLLSGDLTWRRLTALQYHYETQPLPTPIAWYMHQLPDWFQTMSVLFLFFVELVVPFLILGPRRLRLIAAFFNVVFQILILLTGNYTFFNLLAIALCALLLDDQCFNRRSAYSTQAGKTQAGKPVLLVVLLVSGFQLAGTFFDVPEPSVLRLVEPLRIINTYGLFRVMTTMRPEIVIEGSNDGEQWLEYEFRYKPGDVDRRPPWVAPHQPRLDWQMWFAALGNYQQNRWFVNFMARLLQGSPPVLALLERNPFPAQPPRYIRAVAYEYHFTRWGDRAWWQREPRGLYFPAVSLR